MATKPNDATWLTPYLVVKDLPASIKFYEEAFKFTLQGAPMNDELGKVVHAAFTYNKAMFMTGQEGAWDKNITSPATSGHNCPINLYVYVDDVDAFYLHATKHGAVGVQEPTDMFWQDRMCLLKDISGYIWNFATHIG